jgi:hypothetical protein
MGSAAVDSASALVARRRRDALRTGLDRPIGLIVTWYAKQKARHEAAKANPTSLAERIGDGFREKGGDYAREGETWALVSGETVVIRSTAQWTAKSAARTKVKVRSIAGAKLEVLASQLRRVD